MDLRPLHDRVMVKRLDEGEQKVGGIIIPDSAQEKPQQAMVKAVGNGTLLETGERVPLDVKAGDRILFGKYSGSEIKLDGEEYLMLKEEEILGVVGFGVVVYKIKNPGFGGVVVEKDRRVEDPAGGGVV